MHTRSKHNEAVDEDHLAGQRVLSFIEKLGTEFESKQHSGKREEFERLAKNEPHLLNIAVREFLYIVKQRRDVRWCPLMETRRTVCWFG